MSVFLDDCSGDVDCVYFFDGVTCANIWKDDLLPAGSIPTKSLLYLFVNDASVPSIPLESVFALNPLISEGRFHIIKTPHLHSTPILLGFYTGILHCHSSPEIRFTVVSKDPALDIVTDQLAVQGRTVRRISTNSFSDVFPRPSSSSSSSSSSPPSGPSNLPISRPSSSAGFAPGVISPNAMGNSLQLLLPNGNLPPSPSPKGLPLVAPVNTTQTDAEIFAEIVSNEKFNKKTKKRMITKITNKKELQIALINKFLETNNIEKANFICSQFGLNSYFPQLDRLERLERSNSSTSISLVPTIQSSPSQSQLLPEPSPSPQIASRTSHPQLEKSELAILKNEKESLKDEAEPPSPTIQELQQMQMVRKQAVPAPPVAIKKKVQAKALKPPPPAAKKIADTNSSKNNEIIKPKTKTNIHPPLTSPPSMNGKSYSPIITTTTTTTTSTNNSTTNSNSIFHNHHPAFDNENGKKELVEINHNNNGISDSDMNAIKSIAAKLLSRVYTTFSDIRLDWEDPLELALQCLAHMNVTEKHDDQESRYLVRLLLSTMLESGVQVTTVSHTYPPFSLQENAVVIQETLKLLSHWGYTPDVIHTFKEIYMNNATFFGNSRLSQNSFHNIIDKSELIPDFMENEPNSEDEHTWVEGWNARRVISGGRESDQQFM